MVLKFGNELQKERHYKSKIDFQISCILNSIMRALLCPYLLAVSGGDFYKSSLNSFFCRLRILVAVFSHKISLSVLLNLLSLKVDQAEIITGLVLGLPFANGIYLSLD